MGMNRMKRSNKLPFYFIPVGLFLFLLLPELLQISMYKDGI